MKNGFTYPEPASTGVSNSYGTHTHLCEVCDSVIPYPDSLTVTDQGYAVCRSFSCKRIMQQKEIMPAAQFESQLAFNRKLLSQRREKDRIRKQLVDKITSRERKEHESIFQETLSTNPDLCEDNTHLIVIPSGNCEIVAADEERQTRYIEHLNDIINQACEYADASQVIHDEHHDAYAKRLAVDHRLDNNPELRVLSDDLCSLCRGGCCASGKEHAYLSVFSMRRHMDENPEHTAAQIIDLYRSKMSDESIGNSCINHTANGCALPRHLRSDICNGYYCDSLKSHQKKMDDRKPSGAVLVIQRSSSYWNKFEPGVYNKIVNVALIRNRTDTSRAMDSDG